MKHVRIAWLTGLLTLVAACGDDMATTTASTAATVASSSTITVVESPEVAPGAESLVDATSILLREDFQSGVAQGWQIDAGWYVLTNGDRRAFAASGDSWAWYTPGLGWSGYGARLGFRVESGNLAVSVGVATEGRYVVNASADGVHLLRDVPYGALEPVASSNGVSTGAGHTIAVGLQDGHVQVYIDGSLIIDYQDPDPISAGSIGLGTSAGSVVLVDNVVVAGLSGSLPRLIVPGVEEPIAAPDLSEVDLGPADNLDADGHGVATSPDLEVTGVSLPGTLAPGQGFDVSIHIANAGPDDLGPFSVAFLSDDIECGQVVDRLESMIATTVTCTLPGYDAAGDYEWMAVVDSTGVVAEDEEDDNLAAGMIHVGAPDEPSDLPDLTTAWINTDPPSPPAGEVMTIGIGVGQVNAEFGGQLGLVEVEIRFPDGTVACRGRGAVWEEASCVTGPFPPPGEYRMEIAIDPDDAVAESNETNNLSYFYVQVPGVEIPNLAIDHVRWADPVPAGVGISPLIYLDSNLPTGAALYTVRVFIDDALACSDDTDAGGRVGIYCDVGTVTVGPHTWRIVLDADNDIAESDETDNVATGTFVAIEE